MIFKFPSESKMKIYIIFLLILFTHFQVHLLNYKLHMEWSNIYFIHLAGLAHCVNGSWSWHPDSDDVLIVLHNGDFRVLVLNENEQLLAITISLTSFELSWVELGWAAGGEGVKGDGLEPKGKSNFLMVFTWM